MYGRLLQIPSSTIDTTVSGTDTTYDTTTTVTTVGDTMLPLALQSIGVDDSTKAAIAQNRGVNVDTTTNINANPGLRLNSAYIKTQLARTWDFRDNEYYGLPYEQDEIVFEEGVELFMEKISSVKPRKLSGVPPPLKLVLLIFEGRLVRVIAVELAPILF